MARSFLPARRRRHPAPVRALRVLAVVLAVLTARVAFGDLATLHARAASLGPLTPVVVARHRIALGTRLRASDLRVVHRYRATSAPDAVRSIASAEGRTVAVALVAGAELTTAHLAASSAPLSSLVDASTRLVRLRVDDPDPPGPGTVVDVVAAAAETGAEVVAAGAVVVALTTANGAGTSATGGGRTLGGAATSVTDTTFVTVLVRRVDVPAVTSAAALGAVLLSVAPLEAACCRS